MTTHIPVRCSVKDCTNEGEHWIADVGGQETFYLCVEHLDDTDDGVYSVIEGDTSITHHEVAVYACAEDCDVCNN
jgi:hypothetical protein